MSMKVYPTSENTGQIEVGGVARLLFAENGDLRGSTTPAVDADGKTLVTLDMLRLYGGMPRFTPYVWGGRGDAMPEGDTQSSGQQLLDLMYPDMRADVVATQFYCTEAEWQADPYKRVTHWSLGDGVSWMRTPDKNGVQPGNVGAFYGSGSNPAGILLATAVADTFQEHSFVGTVSFVDSPERMRGFEKITGETPFYNSGGGNVAPTVDWDATAASVDSWGRAKLPLVASVGGVPRVANETKPRTWYGIWMIRMYGRVVNTGLLDAPALNARMDMLDARVSSLEGGSSSITKNGYKIHADGLVEQWGVQENVNLNSTVVPVVFPLPFPEALFTLSVTMSAPLMNNPIVPIVLKGTETLSGFSAAGDHNVETAVGNIYWNAKGK